MELDDLVDCVRQNIPKANRSNVYRILRAFSINQVPKEQKEKAKKFKEYKPGYLHNARLFLKGYKGYFPFYITHILTDNGLEFTDKFECAKENTDLQLLLHQLTIKATDYKNIEGLKEDLNKFLIYYNTNRKHGGLKKELKVRTPCEAVKSWFEIEPELFKISPDKFYAIALNGMGTTW